MYDDNDRKLIVSSTTTQKNFCEKTYRKEKSLRLLQNMQLVDALKSPHIQDIKIS